MGQGHRDSDQQLQGSEQRHGPTPVSSKPADSWLGSGLQQTGAEAGEEESRMTPRLVA